MQKLILFIGLLMLGLNIKAQDRKTNPAYDAKLAKTYDGGENGMKMYVLVILKTGSNTTEPKAKTDSLFAGHMENMSRLVKLNKLIVAGPLAKNDKNYRGIFILNTSLIEEAREILATDPAIKANLLATDLFNWYGSAALPAYLETDSKIRKHQ